MVTLISKASRDDIGLTSWWRAIVWASLSLRATLTNPAIKDQNPDFPYANNVRIALGRSIQQQALQAALTIEATLPYKKSEGINATGDFLPHLINLHDGTPILYTADSCSDLNLAGYSVTGGDSGLSLEPTEVDTLEKYLFWVAWEGERSLLDPLPGQLLPISVDFFEESTPDPTIKIKAVMPIDYAAYKASNNLVCSVLNPGFLFSSAGVRAFAWEEITGKPNFHPVAASGDYNDLLNTPTIPANVSDLTGYNSLVRSVNNVVPDTTTGNIDLTVDVGSVDWSSVSNKPVFHLVSTSGSYNDLLEKPNIPTEVSELAGYNSLVKSVNNEIPDPITGNVTLTVISDWSGIQNKPTFHPVATSGDYNDLANKPNINVSGNGSGNLSLLGKKIIYGNASIVLPYGGDGDNNGVVNYIGTQNGSQAFSNPYTDGKIEIYNKNASDAAYASLVDQNLGNVVPFPVNDVDLKFNFKSTSLKPTKITVYGRNSSFTIESNCSIQGSNDQSNWNELAQILIAGSTVKWFKVNVNSETFYQYIRILYLSHSGFSAYTQFYEIEFYGEVPITNPANGSLNAQITLDCLGYALFPDIKVGSFVLPDLANVETGSSFYIYNPHPFSLAINPQPGQTLIKANGFDTINQNQLAFCFALSDNEWIMF